MAKAIKEIADLLARLPGVGSRTAMRLAFHLLESNEEYTSALGESIKKLKENVKHCSVCANISDTDPCDICEDDSRNAKLLCVVENIPDLWAIEKSSTYRGRFHVLQGLLRPLDGIGPDDLNIGQLRQRVKKDGIEEVIVATKPSVEGEATALLVKQTLKSLKVKISRIASGVPHGSEIEYIDSRTLERALEHRRDMS